mmetsp:Transcript_32818/g.58845  ORF Transcript_32818/g.58845 Transcript_32818/m.58845 type:complete len:336 (+) Transcript_32818:292-1299(+)
MDAAYIEDPIQLEGVALPVQPSGGEVLVEAVDDGGHGSGAARRVRLRGVPACLWTELHRDPCSLTRAEGWDGREEAPAEGGDEGGAKAPGRVPGKVAEGGVDVVRRHAGRLALPGLRQQIRERLAEPGGGDDDENGIQPLHPPGGRCSVPAKGLPMVGPQEDDALGQQTRGLPGSQESLQVPVHVVGQLAILRVCRFAAPKECQTGWGRRAGAVPQVCVCHVPHELQGERMVELIPYAVLPVDPTAVQVATLGLYGYGEDEVMAAEIVDVPAQQFVLVIAGGAGEGGGQQIALGVKHFKDRGPVGVQIGSPLILPRRLPHDFGVAVAQDVVPTCF